MRTFLSLLLVSSFLLSACSAWRDSRVNPSNWFGSGRAAPATSAEAENANPLIPTQRNVLRRNRAERYDGIMVAEVTDLVIEPTSTGAIVRVTGRSSLMGAHDVRLVPDNDGDPVDGVLSYALMAVQPEDQGIGSDRARTLRAGAYVSSNTLAATQTVEVRAGTNSLSTRRR